MSGLYSMAPNKFATMLHRKTNKISFVLVYAVLEWALIYFLLLNSFFSYLIIRFANHFGLKPPCLLCSRLYHILNPHNSKPPYGDLICEQHATELARLGNCFKHRKLVESQDMCENCSSSSTKDNDCRHPSVASILRWLKEVGLVTFVGGSVENESSEVNLKCSCCGLIIEETIVSRRVVIRPPLGDFDVTLILNSTTGVWSNDDMYWVGDCNRYRSDMMSIKGEDDHGTDSSKGAKMSSDFYSKKKQEDNSEGFSLRIIKGGYSQVEADKSERDEVLEAEKEPLLKDSTIATSGQYYNETIVSQHLYFYIGHDDYRLIPVELVTDSEAGKWKGEDEVVGNEDEGHIDQEKTTQLCRETDTEVVLEPDKARPGHDIVENLNSLAPDSSAIEEIKIVNVPEKPDQEEDTERVVGDVEKSDENKFRIPFVLSQANDMKRVTELEVAVDEGSDAPLVSCNCLGTEERVVNQVGFDITSSAEPKNMCCKKGDENDVVNHEELISNVQVVEPLTPCSREGPSTSDITCNPSTHFADLQEISDYVSWHIEIEEEAENHLDARVEIIEQALKSNLLISDDLNEGKEDRVPGTPTSVMSLNHLQQKILLLGQNDANEESLDGGILNELESGDEAKTIEHLKAELEAERMAFCALYAELEEERNAAAIAANHTMAMINRLHEQKAAIEMEALQYQRMMEEQSEYDQEALQMMNEILLKKEKENQYLERKLEEYRIKLMDYGKERMKMSIQWKDVASMQRRASSASCCNEEESDGLSIHLNNEAKEEYISFHHQENQHQNTLPADAILKLQESLGTFEEERMSILEQLRVLEEKLLFLEEEEEHHIENMKPFEQFYDENAKDFDTSIQGKCEVNWLENGFFKVNGIHHQERTLDGSKPKKLLTLFDAAAMESNDELVNRNGNRNGSGSIVIHHSPLTKFELEKKSLAIQEEVDHIFERLQALEADREFLKHCVRSLRKGDRGISLLLEILQHLRDLKNVEIQAKNV